MIKFAAVGFTCVDLYENLNHCYPTGNGIDLLFNLMDMNDGLQPSVVTAVGDDADGERILRACRLRNVDVRHVTVVPGGRTARIEMRLNGRDRVHHRADKGVMIPYQPSDADMDFIRAQDYIHTDLSWSVTDLLPDMRSRGAQIYFDFSKRYQHPDLDRVLKNIDYGIFSFEEENEEVRELLRRGCGLGARVLLATFGDKGSLAFDGSAFYRQSCVPAARLVNTVGAGDSYGAGFISGVLDGCGVSECMRRGAERSAQVVAMFEPYPMRETESAYERRSMP